MQSLNLPAYHIQTKIHNGETYIFDIIRKQYVKRTPEEWVRQHIVHYLIHEKSTPRGLVAVEMALTYNNMQKRSDVVIYNKSGEPLMIIECKAPTVKITEKVFEQVAMYNLSLRVPYLMVSNGLTHYCCKVDLEQGNFSFLNDIPDYEEMNPNV